LTAQIGGFRLFNVNVSCKAWDIICMLTGSLNGSIISQDTVLNDGRIQGRKTVKIAIKLYRLIC